MITQTWSLGRQLPKTDGYIEGDTTGLILAMIKASFQGETGVLGLLFPPQVGETFLTALGERRQLNSAQWVTGSIPSNTEPGTPGLISEDVVPPGPPDSQEPPGTHMAVPYKYIYMHILYSSKI